MAPDLMFERRLALSPATLISAYRTMYTSRRIDDKELLLKRQNRIYFQINGVGHEAVLAAAGLLLRPAYDWFFAYYRDRALVLSLGLTPYDQLLAAVAAEDDPNSGARQMPSHWSNPKLNIFSRSSATGTQFLQAVGAAEAGYRYSMIKEIEDRAAHFKHDEVVYVSAGDGTTSEGEFYESLNTACNLKLPVLYLIEDNGYAISVPVEVQTAGGSISRLVSSFPGLYVEECDGTDFLGSYETLSRAVEYARERRGPALVHAHVIRPYSHSQSDDETLYRPEEERVNEAARDPIKRLGDLLIREGVLTEEELQKVKDEADAEVNDGADASRAEYLSRLKGKGGVFKVTANLQRRFGGDRVYNTPLAEANVIGRSIGMAARGLKPVAEIQFFDYIWPAFMQMRDEAPLLRWRSNNGWKCPMVVRVPVGGYLKGGAIYHSQSGVSTFTSIPGWRVVMPSTALDANGLLRTAVRCDDPVLFLEHKHLYRQTYNKSLYPGPDFMIPFGKARVAREGTDLTIITYGALVQRSLVAAKQAAAEEISVEVIDLRSLNPYDWKAIERSVRKTNRALVVYEDCVSWGYGAEIAARIADELFDQLDAPVRRVAALDCFVAYAPDLEDAILPQTDDVLEAIHDIAAY